MSADNVCTILEHAVRFDRKELIKRCTEIVNSDAKAVFQSDSFLSVSHKVLVLIVEQASTIDPLDVYEACKKWAKYQLKQQEGDVSGEKIREFLGCIIHKIRFSEMSHEDFMDNIAKDRILIDSEIVNNLLEMRVKQKQEKIREIPENEILVRRSGIVTSDSGGWVQSGKQDGISFTVSTNAWLTTVDLFLPMNNRESLTGPLEVFEDKDQVMTTNVTLIGKAGKQLESIKLPARVRLQAGKVYSLCQRLKGENSYYGKNCSTHICVDNISVQFKYLTVGSSSNSTNESWGMFNGITLIKD